MRRTDTYYRDFANGKFEYFTYSDSSRVFVSKVFIEKELRRGLARVVDISANNEPRMTGTPAIRRLQACTRAATNA